MKNLINATKSRISRSIITSLCNNRGDFYISDAIRVILAVVLGALLLAAVVLLFNDTILPKVTQMITDLFSL